MPKIRMSNIRKFVRPYRITDGRKFRLKDWDPADTAHLKEEKKKRRTCSRPAWRNSPSCRASSTRRTGGESS